MCFNKFSSISSVGFAYCLVKINVFKASDFLALRKVLKTPQPTRIAYFGVSKSWNCLRKAEIAGGQKKW